MRVVSLVPSWTETLLAAGVTVVGRTRYCIHPADSVAGIPVVGGTKEWDWPAVQALAPDLLLLDKEENPKFMAEQKLIPVLATHITGVNALPEALDTLAVHLQNLRLAQLAMRWRTILGRPARADWQPGQPLPGLIEWGRLPEKPLHNVVYLIWRNPWMTVSQQTFIGSVLSQCGFARYLRGFAQKYPQIELHDFSPAETLLLFSSEPYPFLRKRAVLKPVRNPYAFVDGESFSWFGLRTLEFLENIQN